MVVDIILLQSATHHTSRQNYALIDMFKYCCVGRSMVKTIPMIGLDLPFDQENKCLLSCNY